MRVEESLDFFFPNEKNEILLNPLIFGDYKNALNDDGVVQLYEDYGSYEVVYKIFENVKLNRYKFIKLLFKY